MNGIKHSDDKVDSGDVGQDAPAETDGHRSPQQTAEKTSPVHSIEGANDAGELPDAPPASQGKIAANGDEGGESEAETLISSPVKRREAERQQEKTPTVVKSEKPQKSRIGSLPVPQEDDEEDESTAASPMQSTEVSVSKANSSKDAVDEVDVDMSELDAEGSDDDSLSSPESSRSRAASDMPEIRRSVDSPDDNPRKRKHRASSVSLPSSKRQSMDPPARRRLRGMHSEGNVNTRRSSSPKPSARPHRRTMSTQSALDGTVEAGSNRKRKSNTHFPVSEPKTTPAAKWEESSNASSETTSHAHLDLETSKQRPTRGIGRATSTPFNRASGNREHKRPKQNKYGFTRLAEACEEGNMDHVREWREKDPDSLEIAENAGNKPLQIAALKGNAEVVRYLMEQGCQIDCANAERDTPLIDAAENGHIEVVNLLVNAGVDPLRQNNKGQQALDVVDDSNENDNAPEIRTALHQAIDRWNSSEAKQRREEEEEQRHRRAGPSKELHFMARTYENLLRLVQNNDRNSVQEFLAARVPVDNAIIAAAARTGDLYLVNMLLAEMTEKKALQKAERPMMSVLGSSHFEMVKSLTELEGFNPLWRSRLGKSWPEIAEERNGPMWRQERELLQRLYDGAEKKGGGGGVSRRSSSPVSKRDQGKRRLLKRDTTNGGDDESEDGGGGGGAAKKKQHRRRLVRRKDMRAKSGPLSDESEEEDESESDTPVPVKEDEEMKPPDSPNTRRGTAAGRTRSSSSSQPKGESPKTLRRRSVSSRESALPTLNEEKDAEAAAVEKAKKAREEEAKFAVEQAKRLEAKRKEEEAAEAEAKRVEAEAVRKAEADRLAEERRIAEEKRKAEEVERARKAEEDRVQREKEYEEAKKRYRADVLASLPQAVARTFDPDSEFQYTERKERGWLIEHFMPLKPLAGEGGTMWVLNLQAAALLGKLGLELFFGKEECPYFDQTLTSRWQTAEMEEEDWKVADDVLANLPLHAVHDAAQQPHGDDAFALVAQRAKDRYHAFLSARSALQAADCKARLRRVKLDDVLANVCPLLKDTKVQIDYLTLSAARREEVKKEMDEQGKEGFVGRMGAWLQASRSVGPGAKKVLKVEAVSVVHEK